MERGQSERTVAARKEDLRKRLDAVAWGLLLIMIGVIWLLPERRLPQHAWLIGVGVILLGLNVVRRLSGIKVSGFTVVLGVLAVALGISDYYGLQPPVIPIALVVIGAAILGGAVARRRPA